MQSDIDVSLAGIVMVNQMFPKNEKAWRKAQDVAFLVLYIIDVTEGATHYHAT